MNSEIKAKWVEALRSGRYKQTRGRLRDTQGMCCLGVLCDILHPEGWENYDSSFQFRQEVKMPPAEILREAGLPTSTELGSVADKLAIKNDTGASFSEIADCIENRL